MTSTSTHDALNFSNQTNLSHFTLYNFTFHSAYISYSNCATMTSTSRFLAHPSWVFTDVSSQFLSSGTRQQLPRPQWMDYRITHTRGRAPRSRLLETQAILLPGRLFRITNEHSGKPPLVSEMETDHRVSASAEQSPVLQQAVETWVHE